MAGRGGGYLRREQRCGRLRAACVRLRGVGSRGGAGGGGTAAWARQCRTPPGRAGCRGPASGQQQEGCGGRPRPSSLKSSRLQTRVLRAGTRPLWPLASDTPHLRHRVLRDGREVGGGEGKAAVGAGVVGVKVHRHLLPPAVPVAQVQTVHAHKPVWAGDDADHKGHLRGGRRSAGQPAAQRLPPPLPRLTSEWREWASSSADVCPVPLGTAGAENTSCTLCSFSPAASISRIRAQASPRSAKSRSPSVTYWFFRHRL